MAVLLALLALALAAPTAGAKTPPLRPFPHAASYPGSTWPASDGHRYLVFNQARGTLRVFDTETSRSRDLAVDPSCLVRDATRNTALVLCGENATAYLVDLAALRMRYLGSGEFGFFRIGRHWVEGSYPTMGGHPRTVFKNWRTGRAIDDHSDILGTRDIDSPKLDKLPRGTWTYDREAPYVLKRLLFPRDGTHALVFDRPGSSRVRLSECRRDCVDPSLSARIATWAEGRTARAYDARARRRFAWRLPDEDGTGFARHTSTHVLAGVSFLGEQRLYWARIRR